MIKENPEYRFKIVYIGLFKTKLTQKKKKEICTKLVGHFSAVYLKVRNLSKILITNKIVKQMAKILSIIKLSNIRL